MELRQNVKAILECIFSGFKDELIDCAADRIIKEIHIPGHWEYSEAWGVCKCSRCGAPFMYKVDYDFCPRCGADMRKANNG